MILENSILEKEINKSQACIKKFGGFQMKGKVYQSCSERFERECWEVLPSTLASANQKRKSYHF